MFLAGKAKKSAAFGWLLAAAGLAPVLSGCFNDPGFIVYTVGEEGSRNIAVVQPDGTGPQVVVDHPSDDFSPVWSPSQQRIAFLSDRNGRVDVYVVNADGTGAIQVTETEVDESKVVWSPDGTRLAYVSPGENGIDRIYWLRLADLVPYRLEFTSIGETDPAWSPGGVWVAFVTLDDQGNSQGIRLRNPDGVNQIRVTDGPDWSPVWSPDGRKLAFVSRREGQSGIYVVSMESDGTPASEPRRVTDQQGNAFSPVWSPDSRRIAFLSDRSGSVNVYTISERGSDLRSVTLNTVDEQAVVWGPDGRLLFESRPTGTSLLFVVGENGVQRQLVRGEQPFSQPHW